MYPYLLAALFFLLSNYTLSILFKKYTYEKFFLYVITYFILVNFINLLYVQSINFFTYQALFSIFILFLYAGLYRSVSVKVIIYLYLRKKSIDINDYYKNEFKNKSFNKRIKLLVDNNVLIKKNRYFFLSAKGKKYLDIFKIAQSIYRIRSSG